MDQFLSHLLHGLYSHAKSAFQKSIFVAGVCSLLLSPHLPSEFLQYNYEKLVQFCINLLTELRIEKCSQVEKLQ